MSARTTKTLPSPRTAPTALLAPTTTSCTSSLPKSRRSGFTLIEILIVLAIIATVMAIGLPAIERVTYQRINSTTRRFVGMIRTVRNDSVLLNSIYRLAIDLDKQTYWIENQREAKLLSEEAPRKLKKGEEPPPSNFMLNPKYNKKAIPMPDGVVIDGVLKEKEGLLKTGVVFVHFFPSGINEQAVLYLKREGSQVISYSLLIRPTSGRVEIYNQAIQGFDVVNK